MAGQTQIWSVALVMCLASLAVEGRMIAQELGGSACKSPNEKTVTYLSPPMTAKPGQVNNKYFPAEFPKGHVGIKNYRGELVDENGVPLPLSEVYLHHSYSIEIDAPSGNSEMHLQHLLRQLRKHHKHGMAPLDHIATTIASFEALHHHHLPTTQLKDFKKLFGAVGAAGEARKSDSRLPGSYAIESGKEIEGRETKRILNVHAIDTRGALNRMGCVECRCHLYNATTDDSGSPLPEGYLGGYRCCGDGAQCAVEEGFNGEEKTFHMKYSYEYVDWNECVNPVSIVSVDITNVDGFSGDLVEFTVEGCGDADPNSEECVDTRVATFIAAQGGDVVHTLSHLHPAALNASLWGEDGRLICATTPMYGQGNEAGNEKGYVVGVTSCLGNAGTADAVKIRQGEKLKYVVQSNKVGGPHTGLMGILRLTVDSDGVSATY